MIHESNDSVQSRAGAEESGCVVEAKPGGSQPTNVLPGGEQEVWQGNGVGDQLLRTGWSLRAKRG